MKFIKLATTLTATVALALLPSVAHATGSDTNLLPLGTISNSDGHMGLVGQTFTPSFAYTQLHADTKISGSEINCASNWDAMQLLCDPSPTTNQVGSLTQYSEDTGYTSQIEDESSEAFIVIDLGNVYSFNKLEIYQMYGSDGKVTHAKLYASSNTSDTWPIQSDSSWSMVSSGDVNEGSTQAGTGPFTNTSATTWDFSATKGRYVMLVFQNDGTYGDTAYIEVAGAKLFGHLQPGSTNKSSLANTGSDPSSVLAIGSALTSTGALLTLRRRTAKS